MSINYNPQNGLGDFYHCRCHFLSGREENDGEESHLKLGTDPDEGAANGLYKPLPAELQVEDVVIFIGLQDKSNIIYIFFTCVL